MNILILTKNWVGDVIFEMPAIRVVKENFPGAHLIAVTKPRCVEVLEANPYVDEVIPFDEKGKDQSLIAKLRFVLNLRRRRIDKAFLFHRSGTRARLAYLAGARERIGYDTKSRGALLTCRVPEPEGPIHDVQYFLDLLRAAGLKVDGDYQYEFYFTEADEVRAIQILNDHGLEPGNIVAVQPGANWAPKRWPVEYYRELVGKLIEKYSVQVVITGTSEDEPLAQVIRRGPDDQSVVSLCGKTKIRELGALFSKCQLLIANDSGPLHIGAGVGTNVIGIFGPTAPRETAPLGRGRNFLIHYAPEGVKLPWIGKYFPSPWMEHISVDQVLKVIEREELMKTSARSQFSRYP